MKLWLRMLLFITDSCIKVQMLITTAICYSTFVIESYIWDCVQVFPPSNQKFLNLPYSRRTIDGYSHSPAGRALEVYCICFVVDTLVRRMSSIRVSFATNDLTILYTTLFHNATSGSDVSDFRLIGLACKLNPWGKYDCKKSKDSSSRFRYESVR